MKDATVRDVALPGSGDNAPVSIPPQTPGRRAPDASPIDRLLDEPHRFEFNQAVRLLHAHLRRMSTGERPAIRFRNTLSLSFPPSEVIGIETHRRRDMPVNGPGADGPGADARNAKDEPGSHRDLGRVELTPAFMGLLGANGALPLAYTEQFSRRETVERDAAARAFLDIFQHRAVTLFHEAWRKHRLPLQFEADRRDRYLPLIMCLIGLGEPALRRRLRGDEGGVSDDALAYYCGLLQRPVVSAHHLERVLADYFAVPVRVTQFVGRWFDLDADCQATLGVSTLELGQSTLLGPRTWQRDLRTRVRIGPLNRVLHQRFLPGGPAALALRELLKLVSGERLEYEVRLTLRAADVACVTLPGAPEPGGAGARLGWDSFLISHPCTEDREEAVYDLHDLHVLHTVAEPERGPHERTPQPRDRRAMAA
jgi:type VI secretion system protein ImpH